MTSKQEFDSSAEKEPGGVLFWLIFAAGIVVLLGVWIYFLLGHTAVGWFGNGVISIVVGTALVVAWRWRRSRHRKALELLERWADEDAAKSARPRERMKD
ncbi:MAG TPA: hypothetical protein VGX78_19510 [Pirellulales bacterium]|jgi:membrane protein implicated in regulation of membrane protease activity|nr:hypothetical protein [Pirellulales bacterium]